MRGLLGELATGDNGETMTITDMEASIEHMSRATIRHVDAILMVTEPYFRSLETVGRMAPLAQELGIEHIWAVANKVRSARDEEIIRSYCAEHGVELAAVVPWDEAIQDADREGRALMDYEPTSPAVVAVQGI
ncbi:MAG: cobyrinic acid a,c-diamide synthase, partial [Actinomycetota bacterium]|nr:cobyrinic acid a,c-diamide synthase [Actinomycetota bacterium]